MSDSTDQPDASQPSVAHTIHLLQIGLRKQDGPIDRLLGRLERSDGKQWFANAVANGPASSLGNAEEMLLQGHASLPQLQEVKTNGRRYWTQQVDPDKRLAGLLAYLLAVGAGMFHYKVSVSTRPDREIYDYLLDLATAVPQQWADMLGSAVADE